MIRIQNLIFILLKFLQMSNLQCNVLQLSEGKMPQIPLLLAACLLQPHRENENLFVYFMRILNFPVVHTF